MNSALGIDYRLHELTRPFGDLLKMSAGHLANSLTDIVWISNREP